MTASVNAIRSGPLAEGLLAIEKNQIQIVGARLPGQSMSQLQQQRGGRAAVVGAHEAAARKILGVKVPGDRDCPSAGTRKSHDDVLHGYIAARALGQERVF